MKYVITCAGSGGHINPGIAIANIIKKREKDAEFLFIGTKTGLENELVKKAGYNIVQIRAGRLHRYFTIDNLKNMKNAFCGIFDAKKILKEYKPNLVIGTGGYICVPVMKAATALKIPYIVHESNAYPGMAVKLVAKKAKKILLGFEDAKKRLNSDNTVYTGTPARFDIIDIEKLDEKKCLHDLQLEEVVDFGKKIVFVTGGSQGAQRLNDVVIDMVRKNKPKNYYIVIAVGHDNYDEIMSKFTSKEIEELKKYIRIEKYIYDMKEMYKVASLLVTRAGAMTVTELTIVGKPAILIPLPSAAENHQYYNAKIIEKAGAGAVIEEKELTQETLNKTICDLLSDDKLIEKMGKKAQTLYKGKVENVIYQEICIKKN